MDEHGVRQIRYALIRNYDGTRSLAISETAYRIVATADASRRLEDVIRECGASVSDTALMDELWTLWSDRYVLVSPGGAAA